QSGPILRACESARPPASCPLSCKTFWNPPPSIPSSARISTARFCSGTKAPGGVVDKANSEILHPPEDVKAGKPRMMLEAALREGKWEGTIARQRKNGE